MNKVAHYLQQHLHGEIITSSDALRYFSTDGSILHMTPQLVMYPRTESDLRKATRFTWQLAEKGRVVPITARGMGGDRTGAALGSGILAVMPAHMNKILELDPKAGVVTAEAGISLTSLQQTLHTHGLFLPPISVSNTTATLGGAIANNDYGRYSYKYGPMLEFVRGMRVVLANGELIETKRLTKRELNKKLGLASLEGEIYRSVDKLIEEHYDFISSLVPAVEHGAAGYNIIDVKQKDGSFDLTPLFLGAQGTLGIITEVTLEARPHNPQSELVVAGFADLTSAWKAVMAINEMKNGPAALDFVDATLLHEIQDINPTSLKPLDGSVPALLLFAEIDDDNQRNRKKIIKKLKKICEASEADLVVADEASIHHWERLRDSSSMFLTRAQDSFRSLPILDDAYVPVERMTEFLNELRGLMNTAKISHYAVWGAAGRGSVHVSPLLDLSTVGDRQKLFKLMDAYYSYICKIGGSISSKYAEGRIRSQYQKMQFNDDAISLFKHIKHVFDPMNTLNPGVKLPLESDVVRSMLRQNYHLEQQHTHLPRG